MYLIYDKQCQKQYVDLTTDMYGRWSSHKSIVRYEKAARLAQVFNKYSPALQDFLRSVEEVYVDVVLGLRKPVHMVPSPLL